MLSWTKSRFFYEQKIFCCKTSFRQFPTWLPEVCRKCWPSQFNWHYLGKYFSSQYYQYGICVFMNLGYTMVWCWPLSGFRQMLCLFLWQMLLPIFCRCCSSCGRWKVTETYMSLNTQIMIDLEGSWQME